MGLRQDGFYQLDSGERQLFAIFGTWAEEVPQRSLKGVRIDVWLPSADSSEQHWAIVNQGKPKPLAWESLGFSGRRKLHDWVRTARYLQGSASDPHVRLWIMSDKHAAVYVERPLLDPNYLSQSVLRLMSLPDA